MIWQLSKLALHCNAVYCYQPFPRRCDIWCNENKTSEKVKKLEDEKVEFTNVLVLKEGYKDAVIGTPYVKNAKVEAKVVEHVKDNKVDVFKFKRTS